MRLELPAELRLHTYFEQCCVASLAHAIAQGIARAQHPQTFVTYAGFVQDFVATAYFRTQLIQTGHAKRLRPQQIEAGIKHLTASALITDA